MADPFTAMIVMDVAMIGLSMAMAPHLKGPRLDDLSVSLADYGTPIPRIWGKRKIQPQIIWAEKLHEVEVTDKTKGGKYTQYKYYGTWAVLLCDHEIDAIGRIWFDKRLVYDATRPGPISVAGAFLSTISDNGEVKLAQGVNMRLYKGTEDQTPDHRIEAWCEDRYGPDTCPAYKGSAYIVFQNIPLEQSGNRIPQISVEVIRNKAASYPYEIVDHLDNRNTSGMFYSPDFTRAVFNGSSLEWWDVPSRTLISAADIFAGGVIAVNGDGSFYCGSYGFGTRTVLVSEGGGVTNVGGGIGDCWNLVVGLYGSGALIFNQINYAIADGGTSTGSIDVGFHPTWMFDDVNGTSSWAVGGIGDGSGTGYTPGLGVYDFGSQTAAIVPGITTSGEAYALDNGNDQLCVWQENQLYLINKATLAIDAGPVATGSPAGKARTPWVSTRPGDERIWIDWSLYDTSDLSVVQTEDPGNWSIPLGTGHATDPVYDRINDAMWGSGSDFKTAIRYLNRVSSNGVTLQTIVDDVSEWCGLTGQDTSQLTQTVYGYSVTQGTGKDMIAPLLDIHDVDARPHDFQVQFVNRGSAPSGTILTGDFVHDGDSPRYKVTIQQDTDLPRRITFNFADHGKEDQPNNVIAQRPLDAMNSTREDTIDLTTYVDTPDAAQQKADRYLRRLWNSRERTVNALTTQYLDLEPGDVKALSLDGSLRNVRLDKLTKAQGVLQCEWIRDEVSFAALNGRPGPEQDGRDDETIVIPGPTKGFIIDAPLIQDADNDVNPVLYYAAGSYGVSWGGASVYEGSDGTYDTLVGSIDSTHGATWGFATSALGTANANLWDRGNTLDVSIYGTLTSHTEAELDADPTLNLIALGDGGRWEYIQFATATLTGTSGTANTYALSGFKRGRRGTEVNVATHLVGDQLLVLSKAVATEMGTDTIGDALSFKVQTIGRPLDGAVANDLTYDGDTLRPYAPARIKWTTDGTDMTGEIIRRTRVGGAWSTSGGSIPLSENSEAYEVDILDGSGNVLRTIAVTGTNVFTYAAAEMAADGNVAGVPPACNVYQMSDAVGRGFALAA